MGNLSSIVKQEQSPTKLKREIQEQGCLRKFYQIQSFLVEYLATNCPPGPRFIPKNYVINAFKCTTMFFLWFLISHYQNFTIPVMIYTALHGSYGMIWFFKDVIIPDKSFQENMTFVSALIMCIPLSMYWYIPYLLISGQTALSPDQISPERMMWAVVLFCIGSFLMASTDCQKYIT